MTASPALRRFLALLPVIAGLAAPAAAFDRDQWTGGVSDDGTYTLHCTLPSCTPDTLLSFRLHPARLATSAADYDQIIAAALAELARRGIRAETEPAIWVSLGRATLYRAKRILTLPDGRRQYYVAGHLIGPGLGLSLFAVAPAPATAEDDFDGLVDHLVRHPPRDRQAE